MNHEITSLRPQALWKHFHALTRIPRPSKQESRVREYIVDFAKTHGIEYVVDNTGNVILRKPASPGMENRKGIVLQAHLDMVPQKNGDKVFDFTVDPIEAYIDGEWVTANGTTLGADNGMGVAAILAVMESGELKHGPLEALLTIDEETGMTGAFGLEPEVLQGEILLNLDSETEGELYVGCAGGLDVTAALPYKEEPVGAGYIGYRLEIKGLRGGHSGMEIILQRANSNKLLVRYLKFAARRYAVRLASIDGGGLRNAIPRESAAVILVPSVHEQEFQAAVGVFERIFRSEYAAADPDITLTAIPEKEPAIVMDTEAQRKLINAVYGCPNGVIRMSDSMKGLVETSSNLARVISENGTVTVSCLLRSSVDSAKEDLAEMIASVFELAGAEIEMTGGYEGWKPNMDSPILNVMTESYRKLYGRAPEIRAIHAGLECGIIGGRYPKMDMISFGPTICYPHSPDEKVSIPSVEKFWNFLTAVLENAPRK